MNKFHTVRHQVTIAGRVLEGSTRKPLGGALVEITEMPAEFRKYRDRKAIQYGDRWSSLVPRPDRTVTALDGLFYFLDLPNGDYTLSASVTGSGRRYAGAQASGTVARGRADWKAAFIEMLVQSTAIQGRVSGPGHKAGVSMAEVHIKGSGERTFCDAQGQYLLPAVEPGARVVQVFAQGYRPAAKSVTVKQPGALETVNFTLVREAG